MSNCLSMPEYNINIYACMGKVNITMKFTKRWHLTLARGVPMERGDSIIEIEVLKNITLGLGRAK